MNERDKDLSAELGERIRNLGRLLEEDKTGKATPSGEANPKTWWLNTAYNDRESFLPKLQEYGAGDLAVIGHALTGAGGEQFNTEAGIAFYALGKAARAVEAYRNLRSPSDDTWHDLTVYAMMGRMARQFGGLK